MGERSAEEMISRTEVEVEAAMVEQALRLNAKRDLSKEARPFLEKGFRCLGLSTQDR